MTRRPISLGEEIAIVAGTATLHGNLTLPESAKGLVVFAHGSGSSRFSTRNRKVASALNDRGLGTLLLDLLTEDESALDQETGEYRFDVELLGARVSQVVAWVAGQERLSGLRQGLFGASTGAAAALIAAAVQPEQVAAVVSRGGRPDLATGYLERVRAPTLLIVGSEDSVVLELNRRAEQRLGCEHNLEVVPGATHLFEEPGKLEDVARLAGHWFLRHLALGEERA